MPVRILRGDGSAKDERLLVDVTNMRVSVAAAGLSGRYAAALFDLADSAKTLDNTAADLKQLKAALAESADFRALTTAVQVGRSVAAKTVTAVATTLGLSELTKKFLGVLAQNGRLNALPGIISQFEVMLNAYKGTTTATVTSAHELSADQKAALEAKLKARTGQDIAVDVTVDPSILGGLVVRIGSQQIDTSIKTRLQRLGQQMKGQ